MAFTDNRARACDGIIPFADPKLTRWFFLTTEALHTDDDGVFKLARPSTLIFHHWEPFGEADRVPAELGRAESRPPLSVLLLASLRRILVMPAQYLLANAA